MDDRQDYQQSDYLLDFISEVIEKMIDSQSIQIEKLSIILEYCNRSLVCSEDIQKQFRNGFRTEMKDYLKNQIKELKEKELNIILCKINDQSQKIEHIDEGLEKGLEVSPVEILAAVKSYRSLGFWIKVLSGALVAMASISFVAAKVATVMESTQKTEMKQIQHDVDELKTLIKKGQNNASG